MTGSLRLRLLALLGLVEGSGVALAFLTLATRPETLPADYAPWIMIFGWALGSILIVFRPPPIPSALVLLIWTMITQLVLLPTGFSPTFRLLAAAPVLLTTVLTLPRGWGGALALGELVLSLISQGSRIVWGSAVPGASIETLWNFGTLGLLLIGGAWLLRSALVQRNQALAEVAHLKEGVQQVVQANVGFQEWAASVEQSSTRRERLRITREIHDIVGYTLTNQTMVLQAASMLLDRDHAKLRELLESAEESARSGLQEVRAALRQLRIGAERPAAFLNRLHQLCRTFEQATEVSVELSGAQTPDMVPPELELVLYRLIQEGLTNSFLHGQASRVSVGLTVDDEGLRVHLADNGSGAEVVTEGIGLTGMRERLAQFGGTLDYSSGPTGFTVWATVPRAAFKEEA
jgi:signal transduction histidine kinase